MSWARTGLALPANSARVSLVLTLSARRATSTDSTPQPAALGERRSRVLAGVGGFEPPNDGIKTRCLTPWRHPSICPPLQKGGGRASYSRLRHIRAKRPAEGRELLQRKPASPELVERNERRGRIRAPPAEAPTRGDAFLHREARSEGRAGRALERPRGSHGEIFLGAQRARSDGPLDAPVLAHADPDPVAQVDELKERLQLVIAVGALTRHVQEQIELRARRPVRLCC